MKTFAPTNFWPWKGSKPEKNEEARMDVVYKLFIALISTIPTISCLHRALSHANPNTNNADTPRFRVCPVPMVWYQPRQSDFSPAGGMNTMLLICIYIISLHMTYRHYRLILSSSALLCKYHTIVLGGNADG